MSMTVPPHSPTGSSGTSSDSEEETTTTAAATAAVKKSWPTTTIPTSSRKRKLEDSRTKQEEKSEGGSSDDCSKRDSDPVATLLLAPADDGDDDDDDYVHMISWASVLSHCRRAAPGKESIQKIARLCIPIHVPKDAVTSLQASVRGDLTSLQQVIQLLTQHAPAKRAMKLLVFVFNAVPRWQHMEADKRQAVLAGINAACILRDKYLTEEPAAAMKLQELLTMTCVPSNGQGSGPLEGSRLFHELINYASSQHVEQAIAAVNALSRMAIARSRMFYPVLQSLQSLMDQLETRPAILQHTLISTAIRLIKKAPDHTVSSVRQLCVVIKKVDVMGSAEQVESVWMVDDAAMTSDTAAASGVSPPPDASTMTAATPATRPSPSAASSSAAAGELEASPLLPSASLPPRLTSSSSPSAALMATSSSSSSSSSPPGAWQHGVKYPVVLGSSLQQQGGGDGMYVFRYEFKPASVNPAAAATFQHKPGGQAMVMAPSLANASSTRRSTSTTTSTSTSTGGAVKFSGKIAPAAETDCLLVFNGQHFTLEKVSTTVGLKHEWEESASVSSAANDMRKKGTKASSPRASSRSGSLKKKNDDDSGGAGANAAKKKGTIESAGGKASKRKKGSESKEDEDDDDDHVGGGGSGGSGGAGASATTGTTVCPHCGKLFKRLATHISRCKKKPQDNEESADDDDEDDDGEKSE